MNLSVCVNIARYHLIVYLVLPLNLGFFIYCIEVSANNNGSNETDCESNQVSSLWSSLSYETIEDMGNSLLSVNDLTHMHGLDKISACTSKQVKRDPTKVIIYSIKTQLMFLSKFLSQVLLSTHYLIIWIQYYIVLRCRLE